MLDKSARSVALARSTQARVIHAAVSQGHFHFGSNERLRSLGLGLTRLDRHRCASILKEGYHPVVKIPHETCILVADGRAALVLRNEGDETSANLITVETLRNDENPKTSDLGTDRPGRTVDHATNWRSAVGQTDWHDEKEHRFARRVAAHVDAAVLAKKIPALIVVAPPRTLADLRVALSKSTRDNVILELAKDLTKMPVHKIEMHQSRAD